MSIRDRMRQRTLSKRDNRDFDTHYTEGGDDPGEVPILIAEPRQAFVERLAKRQEAGELTNRRHNTLLIIHCCHAPQAKESSNEPKMVGGEYVLGEPVWEDADIDELEADHHTVGGWLEQLKAHVLEVFTRSVKKKRAFVTTRHTPADDDSSTESPSDTDSAPET